MRFVTFTGASGTPTTGVVHGEQVLDLSHPACAAIVGGTAPTLLQMVEQGLARWADRLSSAAVPAQALRPLAQVKLLAPLRPGKIVGAAFNFTDALAERNMKEPAEPVTFVRSGCTVVGPGEPILIPPDVGNVGYEAELAVVIGKRALRVSPEQAMRCVAGYTAHNDVSGSDLVKGDGGNFVRGKNLPASSPLGPWIATPDEVPDPYAVRIRLDIDGRPLQDGSTATMLFRIAELISYVSHRMPLEPGDVIATGTPAGVAAMHTPAAWLAPGQTVTVEVEGFGRLSNPVQRGEPFLEN
ncbi:fumarylacetoacetate hydrolase family protein [Ramlibacter albus]|uniref:Fumarylacetoacetate hydrolase family protein n=1 Tax=Ramlibacter albus TaxID=2079448 RepID=A0A923MA80_9BURK|nr:fumarylacetoacetate hydrolase family protein [Ramlibacter albus]MBC5765609.1 fumarylacetoacetate hydrolase family protein [Ramlibacter albus]